MPANSFAVAGGQAAIYPWQSPGGWHLLGRTPLTLFDPANPQRPARFTPGDVLRIVPPFVVTESQVKTALQILRTVIAKLPTTAPTTAPTAAPVKEVKK